MNIPSHFLPIKTAVPKVKSKAAVSLEKSDTQADATKQEAVPVVVVEEKRRGEDRRKRNIKPLLDTRTGGDRRAEARKRSVNTRA